VTACALVKRNVQRTSFLPRCHQLLFHLSTILHYGETHHCGRWQHLRKYYQHWKRRYASLEAVKMLLLTSRCWVGLDPLRAHVVYEAMHDSGEVDAQGYCHPGTRTAIQQTTKRWAGDAHPSALAKLMLGAAGAGKSPIMRTMAKVLAISESSDERSCKDSNNISTHSEKESDTIHMERKKLHMIFNPCILVLCMQLPIQLSPHFGELG